MSSSKEEEKDSEAIRETASSKEDEQVSTVTEETCSPKEEEKGQLKRLRKQSLQKKNRLVH